jgi:hypothetical protein
MCGLSEPEMASMAYLQHVDDDADTGEIRIRCKLVDPFVGLGWLWLMPAEKQAGSGDEAP